MSFKQATSLKLGEGKACRMLDVAHKRKESEHTFSRSPDSKSPYVQYAP